MSEKHLTELPWKALAIKNKLKDPGLSRALGEFAKCPETDRENRLKALETIKKHAATLKKENGQNKEVAAYLDEVLKEVATSEKALESLKKNPEKESAEEAGEESTGAKQPLPKPSSPQTTAPKAEPQISLKDKLLAGLGKVKERKPTDPAIAALVCQAGKSFGALLGTGATADALKAVFKNETGHKFIKGTCSYGAGDIYTFTLDSALSGAAKGLKAFFRQQTGRSYKIRVGDPAGKFEEDLESSPVDQSQPRSGTAPQTSPTKQSPTNPISTKPVPTKPVPTTPADPMKVQKILEEMESLVKDVIALDSRRGPELKQGLEVIRKHLAAGEATEAMDASLRLGSVLKIRPIEIFVKSLDNLTLKLVLPQGPKTKVGVLLKLLQGRTALPLSELHLTTAAGKPLDESKKDFTVEQLDIRKETTLTLNGALKGGFGERAAAMYVLAADLRRGNVQQDVQASQGRSLAKTLYLRGRQAELRQVAADAAGIDNDPTNHERLDGLILQAIGAANCDEFSRLVGSRIAATTTGQWIYRCSIVGKIQKDGQGPLIVPDHVFIITYPEDVDIGAMKPDQAMVTDSWFNNQITTLAQYLAKENPYGATMTAANIDVLTKYPATGQDLPVDTVNTVLSDVRYQRDVDHYSDEPIPVETDAGTDHYTYDELKTATKKMADSGDPSPFDFPVENRLREKRSPTALFETFSDALVQSGAVALATEFLNAPPDDVRAYVSAAWTDFAADFEGAWEQIPKAQRDFFLATNDAFFDEEYLADKLTGYPKIENAFKEKVRVEG